MKKTIETKEVLAVIAVAQQALEAGDTRRANLELQILVENICDDEDDETHEIIKVKASIYKDFVERELWEEAEIKKTFEHIRHTGYVYDRQRVYKEFSVFDKDGNCKILIAK